MPGAVLQICELNRLTSVTLQDAEYLRVASSNWRPTIIYTHLSRYITMFMLTVFLQAAVQVNLQSSFAAEKAWRRFRTGARAEPHAITDGITFLSVILTFVFGVNTAPDPRKSEHAPLAAPNLARSAHLR